MSLEEARKVTISVGDKSLIAPPRRIDDILHVLDQSAQDSSAIGQKLRAKIKKPLPQIKNNKTLAPYYKSRGDAFLHMGRYNQALNDLRLAMTLSSYAGNYDHNLLENLAYMEFVCGNFKNAIELMEKSIRLEESPSTYRGLVRLYTLVGDLESAQQAAKRGVSLCGRLKSIPAWGKWPHIQAADMQAIVLDAQGKLAEAESHYRKILNNWSPSMIQQ